MSNTTVIIIGGIAILLGCYFLIACMEELESTLANPHAYQDAVTYVAILSVGVVGLTTLAAGLAIVIKLMVNSI